MDTVKIVSMRRLLSNLIAFIPIAFGALVKWGGRLMDFLDLPELRQKWDQFWVGIGIDSSFGWLIATTVILLILINLRWQRFWWWNKHPKDDDANGSKRWYLSDEDTDLGTAIRHMAWYSAWARWFAAQHLATNKHEPIFERFLMSIVAFEVLNAAMNGKLSMRGRPSDSINYEAISRETWRLIAINMDPDPRSLWKAVIRPRSDVDRERVQHILDYDSIILSSREFEQLWPRDNKRLDKARMKLLKKAKRLGADPQEIEKLAK